MFVGFHTKSGVWKTYPNFLKGHKRKVMCGKKQYPNLLRGHTQNVSPFIAP